MATVHIDDVSLENTVVVRDTEEQVAVATEERIVVVTEGSIGPEGKKGDKGEKGDATVVGVSADPGNNMAVGGDGGLYVPDDIPTDPLAYYILARS